MVSFLIYSSLGGLTRMGVRKTSVEIDEELLEAARRILETTTVKDTVEEAFREVARVEARRQEVETLTLMEELDLADPEIMAGAWRS
jgi:Arc/MetJ family transcription regulator